MEQTTSFKITGLPLDAVTSLFELSDEALVERRAQRCIVDNNPGYPCRVSLRDAEVGEEVILLPFEHQSVDGPYRSLGPIFVRVDAEEVNLKVNEIPVMLRHRLLSVRGYDETDMMCATRVAEGHELDAVILALFADEKIKYLHVHNAGPGCFNCRVDRVS